MNSYQAGPFAENAATPRGYGPEIQTGPQFNVGDEKSSQSRGHYKVTLFKKIISHATTHIQICTSAAYNAAPILRRLM